MNFSSIKFNIRRWSLGIIIALCVLFFLKSCQSCSRKQQILFYEKEIIETKDSLTQIIDDRDSIILLNEKKISNLEIELTRSKELIDILSTDKNQYIKALSVISKISENDTL